MAKPKLPTAYGDVHTGIVELLESARRAAARSVNALMTASYWEIGRRIVEFEQGGRGRAKYGEALIERLAEDLTHRFGRGFSRQNLQPMRAFYLAWPSDSICQAVSGEVKAIENPQTPSAKSSPLLIRQTPSGLFTQPRHPGDPLPAALVGLRAAAGSEERGHPAFYETEALRYGWSVRQLDRQIGSQLYERVALSRNPRRAATPLG